MFFTSRKRHLSDNIRQINISEDSQLPQLYRLCSDFGFAVLGFNKSSATPKEYVLCEVDLANGVDSHTQEVTPKFASLTELEAHASENVVEIVQKYLFGDDDNFADDSPVAVA